MFYLGVFVGLWVALVIYGLSRDVKRFLHNWRLKRAFRRLEREREQREKTLNDMRESLGGVCH